jgi:hypothetical protein
MNSELKSLQKALKNRKAELEKLIDQMKTDELNKSSLYKNLQNELVRVEGKLNTPDDSEK